MSINLLTPVHNTHTRHLADIHATKALAKKISSLVSAGDIITLQGDLGVGKTVFSQAFIQQLLNTKQNVTSPTFTLLQIYESNNTPPVWHFDLYRLQHQEEVLELGIEDGFGEAVMLIEWPKIIIPLLPEDRLDITLSYGKEKGARDATIIGYGRFTNMEFENDT